MMSELKRWKLRYSVKALDRTPQMVPTKQGGWILYIDHVRIVAELEQELVNQALTIDEAYYKYRQEDNS